MMFEFVCAGCHLVIGSPEIGQVVAVAALHDDMHGTSGTLTMLLVA